MAKLPKNGTETAAKKTEDSKADPSSDDKPVSEEGLVADRSKVKDTLSANKVQWSAAVKELKPFHERIRDSMVEYMLEYSPTQILRGVAAMVIQMHIRSHSLRYIMSQQNIFPLGTPVWVSTNDAVTKQISWARGTVTTEPSVDEKNETKVGVEVTYARTDSKGNVESLTKPVQLPKTALVRRFDFLRTRTDETDLDHPTPLKNQEFLTKVKVLTLTTRKAVVDRKHKFKRKTAADTSRVLMWQEAVVIGGTVVDVPLSGAEEPHFTIDSEPAEDVEVKQSARAKDLLIDAIVFSTGELIKALPWQRVHIVWPPSAKSNRDTELLQDLQDSVLKASRAGNASDIVKYVNCIYHGDFPECHDSPEILHFPLGEGELLGDLTAIAFDANDADGNSPLHLAVAGQHLAATRMLIGLGIDTNPPAVELDDGDLNDDIGDELDMPDPPCPFGIVTPLLSAIALGDAEIVAALFESENKPYTTGKDLRLDAGALYLAALRCEPEIVKVLLEHGTDPNEVVADDWQAQSGWTVMHLAASENLTDVVSELLKHPDCNVDKVNIDGSTPLMMCVAKGMQSMSKHLVDHKADPNIKDVDDVGPLEVAVCQSDIGMAEILLKAGATQDDVLLRGHNLVSIAAFAGDFDIMKVLAKHGADLKHQNNEGEDCIALLKNVHGLTYQAATLVDVDVEAGLPGQDTREWAAEARKWFRKIDTDNSHYIDNAEFRDYMIRLGLNDLYGRYFDKMIDLEFLKMDRSNKADDTITFPEFQNCFRRFLRLNIYGGSRYDNAVKIQALVRGGLERRRLDRSRTKILSAIYSFASFKIEVSCLLCSAYLINF